MCIYWVFEHTSSYQVIISRGFCEFKSYIDKNLDEIECTVAIYAMFRQSYLKSTKLFGRERPSCSRDSKPGKVKEEFGYLVEIGEANFMR